MEASLYRLSRCQKEIEGDDDQRERSEEEHGALVFRSVTQLYKPIDRPSHRYTFEVLNRSIKMMQ